MPDEQELWRWEIPSSTPPGKRIKSRWHMTEATAREHYGDAAVKIEGTLMKVRDLGSTSDFLRSPEGQ